MVDRPRRRNPGHVPWRGLGLGRTELVPATLALRIVGLLTVRRKEAPAMAGADRMTIEEVVRQVLSMSMPT